MPDQLSPQKRCIVYSSTGNYIAIQFLLKFMPLAFMLWWMYAGLLPLTVCILQHLISQFSMYTFHFGTLILCTCCQPCLLFLCLLKLLYCYTTFYSCFISLGFATTWRTNKEGDWIIWAGAWKTILSIWNVFLWYDLTSEGTA